ncbi:MAG: integrase, partial [Roseburia sp.]|nr:integrase [Roseburia sp.]
MAVIKNDNYHDEQTKQNIIKLRAVMDTLPSFCRMFFRGIEEYTSARTRLAYAYDIRLFFEYLHEKNSYCAKLEIKDFPLSLLEQLHRVDIEEYLEYISLYQKDGRDITNDERGKSRKLASLRSLYNYFYENEMIEKNPAALVPLPKRHEKEIIRLEPNEVAILLDQVEDGTKLT